MSIKAMNWAWGQALAPTSKLILMALADAADDDGLCWPGIRTLASKCCVSGRTVQRTIKTFITQGMLTVQGRRRPDGRQTSNSYLLALNYPDILSPQSRLTGGGGDNSGSPGVTQLCQGGDDTTVSPQEPPLEYINKPPQPGNQGGPTTSIIFPKKLSAPERDSILSMTERIPRQDLQQLVDELASVLASGNTIRTTPLRWFQGVLKRYERGEFVATGAIETAKRRLRKTQPESSELSSAAAHVEPDAKPQLLRLRKLLATRMEQQ